MNLVISENQDVERGKKILGSALSLMPRSLGDEIRRITERRKDCPLGINEIRIRRGGISSIVISGESIRLHKAVTEREMQALFDKITGGSLYAFERELGDGYITLENGIRVGIARSEIKTESRTALAMVFRLPLSRCTYANELFELS